MATKKEEGRQRRKLRIRKKVVGSLERPRLTIFRSSRHIYAQVIDDIQGTTILSVSTLSQDLRETLKGMKKRQAAEKVGAAVAELCRSKDISKVVFDRNGYLYHGRIKALADGARKAGLNF